MLIYQRALAALVLVCGAALCPTRADIFPIPLPSFNVDVVKEPGGTTTASLGNHGEAYVTQSFAAANDSVSPKGLPDNGLLGAVQLGPYNGNNAFRIFPQQSGPQLGGPGGQGMVLHILAAAGDGYIVLNGNLTPVHATAPLQLWVSYLQHPDGLFTVEVPNFLGGSGSAGIFGMDTTDGPNGFLNNNSAAIYDIAIGGLVNPALPPFAGVRIAEGLAPANNNLYIFGAYAVVPEPAGLALLAGMLCLSARRRARTV